MGKKKIQIEPLETVKARQLTLAKRKKGLVKKAMELAILCNADIFLSVTSEENPSETIFFSSKDLRAMNKIISRNIKSESKVIYYKNDYEKVFGEKKPKKLSSSSTFSHSTPPSSVNNNNNNDLVQNEGPQDILSKQPVVLANSGLLPTIISNTIEDNILKQINDISSTYSEMSQQ